MAADAGQHWITECAGCFAMFRDSPETAGVCPHCGHENDYSDEDCVTTAPVKLDHPCSDHNARRCLLCCPPLDVWVDHGGGDWARLDADGTRWAVCPDRPGVWTLGMRYHDLRLASEHPSKEAAMQHRDSLARAFTARLHAREAAYPQCAVCLHVRFLRAERDEPLNVVSAAVTTLHGTAVCQLHIEDVDHASGKWLIRMVAGILGPHTPGQR